MIEYVVDLVDEDRLRTWEYLARLLPNGGMFPFVPRELELARISAASVMMRAVDEGRDVGAAYIGPSWEEADDAALKGQSEFAELIAGSVRTLHGIAVVADRRGAGLGSALLREAEQRAIEDRVGLIIGVADGSPSLGEFYGRHGYAVGAPARPLLLKGGRSMMVFPQDSQNARWFFKLVKPGAPVHAIHPSERQLRMIAARWGGAQS